MRHSDISLTLNRYTHLDAGQEADAIAKLPNYSKPKVRDKAAESSGWFRFKTGSG
ncbi:MAG TPA: hypothetical protein VM141_10225 [Planctomycetota bacterium]|nr:hypothetical protein [Planctomycetota bacterium]